MRDKVKLRCDSGESIDEKIDRLRLQKFESNQLTIENENLSSEKGLVLSKSKK